MLRHELPVPTAPARSVVIGAAGFVGAELMRRLEAASAPALGVTRREVDLLAPGASDKLRSLLRPGDCVVAVSAMAPVKNTAMLADNMILTRVMVAAISAVPVSHVVNVSSDAIYGDEPLPLTEGAPAAPGSLHGAMHLAREIAFRSEMTAPLAIVRPTLIYGAADPHNGYGPNRFRRQANEGQDIVLFGEGEEQRDHVLVDDVAELIWRIVSRRSRGTLNIATGAVHCFKSIAERVVAASPRKVAIKGSPRSGPIPHNGYRPFDAAATRAAFPDFAYCPIDRGIVQVQAQVTGAE